MSDKFNYRDSLLRRIQISVSDPIESNSFDELVVQLAFESIDERTSFHTSLVFSPLKLAMLGVKEPYVISEKEMGEFVKWTVINGTYRNNSNLLLIEEGAQGNISYQADRNGKLVLNYPPLIDLPVRESQLCRRAIIFELYHAGIVNRKSLLKIVHMPERSVQDELNGLGGSQFLGHMHASSIHDDHADIFLTTAGREYYEKSLHRRTGVAFIIAACHAYDPEGAIVEGKEASHLKVLELFKSTLSGAGYDPKFQEHEEPHKNIYVDIFDYIDTSEIVIADITWERPSCYIEIGYALARQKPTLLFVEAGYFKSRMKERLPFDLSVVKYQEYSYGEPEKLIKDLLERVNVWRGR